MRAGCNGIMPGTWRHSNVPRSNSITLASAQHRATEKPRRVPFGLQGGDDACTP